MRGKQEMAGDLPAISCLPQTASAPGGPVGPPGALAAGNHLV